MASSQTIQDHIRRNEGDVEHPYLDNKGLITIGPGLKIEGRNAEETKRNFMKLNLQTRDSQTGQIRPATDNEKQQALQAMQSEQTKGANNRDAEAYKKTTALVLPKPERDQLLDDQINTRIEAVKKEVGSEGWERLNDGQKAAILDVHYANGSLKDFPKLKKAIENSNAEDIGKNVDFHSGGQYNEERIIRNRAAAQGISEQEARRQFEEDRKNGKFDPPAKPDKQPDLSTIRPEPRPQPEQVAQPAPNPQTPEPPAPQPSPEPAPAPAPEQKQSEASADPKMASLVSMAKAPIGNPGQSALLKPVEKLTQPEMTDMIHSAQEDYRGWRAGDPLKDHTYEKVQDWHVNIYGDGPQRNDGGKPIDPTPIRPIPETPAPHVTPDGEDLWQAAGRLGETVAQAAETDGADKAVKGLQRGLNMLNEANPLPPRSPAYGPYTKLGPVDEDGQYGPQTDFALKHATARLGAPKVAEAFALGRFNTFARNAQRSGNADGLEQAAHAAFGPLLRAQNDTGPKVEAGVLQETLNGIGAQRHDDWQDLKVDNWIGPKTTEAFGRLLKTEDSDALTKALARRMGML